MALMKGSSGDETSVEEETAVGGTSIDIALLSLLPPSHFKISTDFRSLGGGFGRNSVLRKGAESIPDWLRNRAM